MPERMRRWLLLLAFVPFLAWTAEIDIVDPQISASDDGYILSADFNLELNQRLEEAVTKGLMLYFVADFELTKGRWYWVDAALSKGAWMLSTKKLPVAARLTRIPSQRLTCQYRLSSGGGLHQSFSSLTEAMAMLSHLRNWMVIEKADKAVRTGEPYQAALRLRLDITQLPKPFQMTSLGNKDWSLSSDWKTWQVSLPALTVDGK